jgi:uncharacterized membrane protein YhaH (DUF805 family)
MDSSQIALPHRPEPPTLAQTYFGFGGRVSRRTFWLHGVLGLLGFGLLATALLDIARVAPEAGDAWVDLLLLWPSLALSVKRWHDRDKSAWWLLLVFLPGIGAIWFLVECGFLRGTAGPNRYGADPLAASIEPGQ